MDWFGRNDVSPHGDLELSDSERGLVPDFDGTDDYVVVSSFDPLLDIQDELTLSAWIRPRSFDN